MNKNYLIFGIVLLLSISYASASFEAVGGVKVNLTVNGSNYTAHIFNVSGTSSFNVTKGSSNIEILIVGGGGGASNYGTGTGGGGGAGGLIYNSSYFISISNNNLTVGSGGVGGTASYPTGTRISFATSGSNSIFGSLIAIGGGYGGEYFDGARPADGGSGGGSGQSSSATGANGTLNQGFNGGQTSPISTGLGSGGGGGAGGSGKNSSSTNGALGGDGGNGLQYNLTGILKYYAGGGGGGTHSTLAGQASVGGLGGGGAGAGGSLGQSAVAGTNGLGGGGGGGGQNNVGADGGSGIIIIRYLQQNEDINYNNNTVADNSRSFIVNNSILINTTTTQLPGNITTTHNVYYSNGSLFFSNSTNQSSFVSRIVFTYPDKYYFNATSNNSAGLRANTLTRTIYIYNLTNGQFVNPISNYNLSSNNLSISWSNATSTLNATNITNYNITLLNSTGSLIKVLYSGNKNNFTWSNIYNENLSISQYRLGLYATDSNNVTINSYYINFSLITNCELLLFVNNYLGNSIYFNISVTNGVSRTYLDNFNNISLNLIKNTNYTIILNATGYVSSISNYMTNGSNFQSTNYVLFPAAAIFINIFDESTLSRIYENITVTLTDITNPDTITSTTTSSNISFTSLRPNDLWEVRLSSVNYSNSRYYRTVISTNYDSLDVYLLRSNISQNLSICFYDSNAALLTNFHIFQYSLSNDGYVLIQDIYTDLNGKAIFSYNPVKYYLFNYSEPGYLSSFFYLNPPNNDAVLADGCNYDAQVQISTSAGNYSSLPISSSFSFNNVSKVLTFNYYSLLGSGNYSYTISKENNGLFNSFCYNYSINNQDSFTCDLTGYQGIVYIQGVYNGTDIFYSYWFDGYNLPKLFDNLQPKDAAYLAGFIMLIITMGGIIFGIPVTLGLGVAGLIFIYWLGLLTVVSLSMIGIDILVVMIINIVTRGRR